MARLASIKVLRATNPSLLELQVPSAVSTLCNGNRT